MERLKWRKGHFISSGQLLCDYKGIDKTGKEIKGNFQIISDDWGTKKKWSLYHNNTNIGNFKNKKSAKIVAELLYNG